MKWADTVLETAVNQPLLPYAIVVINDFEVSFELVCSAPTFGMMTLDTDI